MPKLSDENEAYLRQVARCAVRAGYRGSEEIEESLVECAGDFDAPLAERDARLLARGIVIEEIEALRREQQDWPALTDYDRLRLAFDKLEDDGIIARENWTCCGTCGVAEIGGEVEDFEALGRQARGFVFFHMQDTERAVAGDGLYFNYGAFTEADNAQSIAIGRQLFETLASVGLRPAWDGSLDRRVQVSLAWQRPWTGPVPKPVRRWFF